MADRMMDALVKTQAGTGLALQRMPVPEPGPGEVRIKIKKTAICGTDVHIYNWDPWSQLHIKPPMIIGHEYVGEIDQLGAGVTGLYVGQLVSGEGHITCGHCRNCHNGNIQWCKDTVSVGVDRNGAFAEYLCIPASNVIIVGEGLPEEIVLITGAGPIGVIAGGICKFAGARRVVVTDLNDYRLDLARKMGVDAAVNTGREDLRHVMEELRIVEGFDVGLEMSGSGIELDRMTYVFIKGG